MTLTLRALNRTTLSRQLLLERSKLSLPAACEQVLALQAQDAKAPYIGLWTRLAELERDDVAKALGKKDIVRATMMRATIHMMSAADFNRFREALQPSLTRAFLATAKKRLGHFDIDAICEASRDFMKTPKTFVEVRDMLMKLAPKADERIMGYAVRTHLPLVMVPADHPWTKSNNPAFFPGDSWLAKTKASKAKPQSVPDLIRRYLAAFGPATVADMQTCLGIAGLRDVVEPMRDELVSLRDEKKKEYFDLPKLARLDGDEPAPVRFLPEYDNILLAHAVRTRIVPDAHRKEVFLAALRVRSTFLVDGFVAGAWRVERKKDVATLELSPFEKISKLAMKALVDEGERLVRFIEPDARKHEVKS